MIASKNGDHIPVPEESVGLKCPRLCNTPCFEMEGEENLIKDKDWIVFF